MKWIYLITIILFIGIVSAGELRVVLTNPQTTFRSEAGDTIEHYIGVKNKNTFETIVKITPPEGINIEETEITLEPNESREIPYSSIAEEGNYSKNIMVNFQGNGSTFTLTAKLFFMIQDIPEEAPIEEDKSTTGGFVSNDYIDPEISNVTDLIMNETDILGYEEDPVNDIVEEPKEKSSAWKGIIIVLILVGLAIVIKVVKHKKRKNENRD